MKTERHGKRLILDCTPNEANIIQTALEELQSLGLVDNPNKSLVSNMIATIDVS